MIIGTLTYHRADNYGAVLQSYALFKYLCEQGYEAEIIDYWPKHHAIVYKLWCWDQRSFHFQGIKGKILYLLNYPLKLYRNYKRKRNFNVFRKHTMRIMPRRDYYNAVFYGSDTIWNKWNQNTRFTGFDTTYWGDKTIIAKHKFTYAPSMGNIFNDKYTKDHCEEYLHNFEYISVRENSLKKMLEDWGYKNICITVDPTMLLSRHSWDLLSSQRLISEDYVVCYNLEQSKICSEMAERIGKERKMRVIQLTGKVSNIVSKDYFDIAGPIEFLSLVSHASYMVTSSFHGCVFSIIFNKQFCYHSNVETERISSLLDSYNLTERFVKKPDTSAMYKPINFEETNKLIEKNITASKQYIANCLKNIS